MKWQRRYHSTPIGRSNGRRCRYFACSCIQSRRSHLKDIDKHSLNVQSKTVLSSSVYQEEIITCTYPIRMLAMVPIKTTWWNNCLILLKRNIPIRNAFSSQPNGMKVALAAFSRTFVLDSVVLCNTYVFAPYLLDSEKLKSAIN